MKKIKNYLKKSKFALIGLMGMVIMSTTALAEEVPGSWEAQLTSAPKMEINAFFEIAFKFLKFIGAGAFWLVDNVLVKHWIFAIPFVLCCVGLIFVTFSKFTPRQARN